MTGCRYEIADGDNAWEEAERKIREGRQSNGLGSSTTVSVKSIKPAKRKVEGGESANAEKSTQDEHKKKKKMKQVDR